MFNKSFLLAAAAGALALAIPAAAQAQWKPTRNVELIVGTDPGGAQDRMVRLLQSVIDKHKLVPTTVSVVNKAGAAQLTAIAYMNGHRADPHYITFIASAWQNDAIINNNLAALKDVTPLMKLFDSKGNYAVRPDSPLKGAQDLVAALKKDPGSVTFTMSAAPGSQNWLTIIKFAQVAGADPRKLRIGVNSSGAETTTAVLGGHADIAIGGVEGSMALIESGKLRNLGLISDSRVTGTKIADWQTMKEQGVDAVSANWYAMVGPRGITPDQTAYWEGVLQRAMDSDEVKKFALDSFRSRETIGAKDFQAFLDKEEKEQRTVMTQLGLIKG